MTSSKTKTTYADAGVDITAGNNLVENIKPLAKSTIRTGADTDLGGFGGLFDLAAVKYKDPILVSATDGVGTKLKLAFSCDKHDTVGIDLVAMCVNDLVVQGAEPLFFLDYFATGGLDVEKATDVVAGIAAGCKQAGCALIGGETAEMPGMYQSGHYDLAGFAVGAVERDNLLPSNDIKEGDIVIGIKSNGFHSNGFSLVRYVLDNNKISFSDKSPLNEGKTVGEELLTPTRIYIKSCLAAYKAGYVKAFSHITGGGLLENIPRVLDKNIAARIDSTKWELPEIFKWVQDLGNIETSEMHRTFNCGIGMVAIVAKENADNFIKTINENGDEAFAIGDIVTNKENQQVIIEG